MICAASVDASINAPTTTMATRIATVNVAFRRLPLRASSRGKPPYGRQYEHDYSGISHVCCPIFVILNRKTEQEWYREKKENDIT